MYSLVYYRYVLQCKPTHAFVHVDYNQLYNLLTSALPAETPRLTSLNAAQVTAAQMMGKIEAKIDRIQDRQITILFVCLFVDMFHKDCQVMQDWCEGVPWKRQQIKGGNKEGTEGKKREEKKQETKTERKEERKKEKTVRTNQARSSFIMSTRNEKYSLHSTHSFWHMHAHIHCRDRTCLRHTCTHTYTVARVSVTHAHTHTGSNSTVVTGLFLFPNNQDY